MYTLLSKVKEGAPLVLHYTNEVTINECANMTLAVGASPLMSYSYEEVEEIVSIASSVVINIGTMNSSHLELFVAAGKAANKYNKPVILDPVGIFATKTRADFTKRLLEEVKFTVIKGNLAEIKFLGGLDVKGTGVDSHEEDEDAVEVLKNIAKEWQTTVVATGVTDVITNGEEAITISNGTTRLKGVTGTGCMTASLIGSYLGVGDALEAAAMGVLTMALAGELADTKATGIGNFRTQLFNEVSFMTEETLTTYGKVERS